MKGAAACTENAVGKGRAVYYGSYFNLDAARYLMAVRGPAEAAAALREFPEGGGGNAPPKGNAKLLFHPETTGARA